MNLVSATIARLAPYEAGKPVETLERELGVTHAIKLASNENPLGPSPKAVEAAARAFRDVHRYPDAAAWALREKLARKLGVKMAEIIHGNGSSEVLELSVRTFVGADQHVIFAKPSFAMYKIICMAAGVSFAEVPLRDHAHDLDAMAAAVTDATRLIFIANPNNPTGTYVNQRALASFLKRLPPSVTVVMDEAYREYADAPDYPDALHLRGEHERLIVARTFSKIYGLAAQRIGYAVGPESMIDYMNRIRPPFNVSSPGQMAAVAALDDDEHVRRSQELNRQERTRLADALSQLGLQVTPSQANFLYVNLRRPARPIYDALLRLGVIVRQVAEPQALRITVGLVEENDRLLATLRQVLQQ